MALINCPECNKEISNQSDKCIHCGFPINKQNKSCIINGVEYNVSFLLDNSIPVPLKGKQLYLLTNCDLKACLEFVKKVNETNEIPKTLFLKAKENTTEKKDTPKCPTCSSTNIHKISGLESGASILTFGIFSKKINKSFECCSCKYTW